MGSAEPVIPDGCAELIVNLGAPFEQRAHGSDVFREQPAVIVNGQLHGAVSLRSHGTVRLVGVRLQPWALGGLIRLPAHQLTDQWCALGDITFQMLPDLRDHLLQMCDDESVHTIVAQHFRLMTAGRQPDDRLRRVVNRAALADATSSVGGMSRDMGVSERTLQRMFADEVGLSAKQYGKVLRIQRAVRLRQENSRGTWSRAALDAGYYDQSHFVKDFRAIVGCAPTAFIVERETLTDAFMTEPA